MLLSDEQRWPDDIEPLHAGLSDEEFADPLDQDRWTEGEVALLRAAGMQVVTLRRHAPRSSRPTSYAQAAAMWSGTLRRHASGSLRLGTLPPRDHRPGAGERAADLAP
jgi:hypothetical protein